MTTFKQFVQDYENLVLSESYNIKDEGISIPDVSFIDKENYLLELKDQNEEIIQGNSKLLIDICRRVKKAFDEIIKCMKKNGYSKNIDFSINEQYIDKLLSKIRYLLYKDDICDMIDELGDDLIFLENFCKNKNIKKLEEVLEHIDNIIRNFENLETY